MARKGRGGPGKPPSQRPNRPLHLRRAPDIGELFRNAPADEKVAFVKSLDAPREGGASYAEILADRAVHDREVALYGLMAFAWRKGYRRVRYLGSEFVMKQDPTSEAMLATIGDTPARP